VIENIPVSLPQGGTLPLKKLADIQIENKVTTIARSWGQRYAAVSINLRGRDIQSFVTEAQSTLKQALQLPSGYQLYWGGQFKNLAHAQKRLWLIVPLTLLVVFLILLRNFKSFQQTLLIFSTIPFATLGGVFSLYSRGLPFSVSASIGFIALIGIALLNGIVMVTVFNHLRLEQKNFDLTDLVIEGSLSRLRPVLMTALVASLGFLPMALNQGLGSEVQRPLATVVMGGLMSSTGLTLLLLPSLYLWIERKSALQTKLVK
jgi:cobalt-zinc-cadmium resistance protein CzcA